MSYTRVNWKDYPDESTPITADNLNKMDAGIAKLDETVGDKSVKSIASTISEAIVETYNAVTKNTSSIATNTSSIATNTSNIATNTTDITTLKSDRNLTYHDDKLYYIDSEGTEHEVIMGNPKLDWSNPLKVFNVGVARTNAQTYTATSDCYLHGVQTSHNSTLCSISITSSGSSTAQVISQTAANAYPINYIHIAAGQTVTVNGAGVNSKLAIYSAI